jgi:hypothetical protein
MWNLTIKQKIFTLDNIRGQQPGMHLLLQVNDERAVTEKTNNTEIG